MRTADRVVNASIAEAQIRYDSLDQGGQRLSRTAARFATALAAFQAELAGYGQPWGGDDIGSLIGAAHDEVSSWAFECYASALEEIDAAGVDLAAMAERYRGTDAAASRHFSTIDVPTHE